MASGNGTLEGKVAIITGGGTGLGRAMVRALAREGATIAVVARRREPIEESAKEAKELGGQAIAISADLTDSAQVNGMMERAIRELGKVDFLINNAGIVRGEVRKPLADITDEEWHLGIDTNLTTTFYCCRAVSRHFLARKSGKIINVASGMGIRASRDAYMYCCAKGGVIQLTRVLAFTWSRDNIQVNCVVPGFVDASELQPATDIALKRPRRAREDFIPVGRFGRPEDIGSLGLFFASDASDYITGAIVAADGAALATGFAPTDYLPLSELEEV